ncbi:MAG: FIST C-terminal domain-containing protein, partial [Desulfofustis sp.]|nr:FIST C-terminal domain-containing protein [Desulfofustis sp.]
EANVLHEIDGKRATEFYDDLLGGYSDKLEIAQFPLAVYEPQGHDFCLRDPFLLDREAGTVTCVGTFPNHCRVRLTTISREDILRTAHEANERILAGHPAGRPELILLFPCTSRRHVLGTRTNEEFAALRQADPPQAFFGFYCYGEIGPLAPDGPSGFHSDTYIAVALSERS